MHCCTVSQGTHIYSQTTKCPFHQSTLAASVRIMIYNLELSKEMFEQVKFSPVDIQYLRSKDILRRLLTNKLIFSVNGKIIFLFTHHHFSLSFTSLSLFLSISIIL